MPFDQPKSDLEREGIIQHESPRPWPKSMHIVAMWPDGQSTMYQVSAEEFYGGGVGVPMGAAALLGHMERLARQGPPRK